jgi:hypothetical protein
MQKDINRKIDDAFSSLDGIKRASPAPFFFTRLEAHILKKKNAWEGFYSFVTRPAIAFAGICLILVINAAVIFSSHFAGSTEKQNSELATVDEYNQVSSSLYEFVNTNP